MFQLLTSRIKESLGQALNLPDASQLPDIAIETPPNLSLGEVALPLAFTLAKQLRRAPRAIAQELVPQLQLIPMVSRVEVAGAGYLNLYLNRTSWTVQLLQSSSASRFGLETAAADPTEKLIIEHTNINPNKAAHIGHLRNAVLGDSFVRVLRFLGHTVEVQNYLDNTGVQVADVVVGFKELAGISPEQVLASGIPFDYFCWDLYARVTHFLAEDSSRAKLRQDALQEIESGIGETARIAEFVALHNVKAHLATMNRLQIKYDLLPRESDILHMHFWENAFSKLKASGAIHLASEGKNSGCWIMKRQGDRGSIPDEGEEAEEKVIVRSNGTVTYVGKDIAYQLWKLGLLGLEFKYHRFLQYQDGHQLWASTSDPDQADPGSPAFGHAKKVYNVIDQRQSYLQDIVVDGLRALGFHEQAENSVHFSYEMVALSPRCCAELGFELSEQDRQRQHVEVSGRKGLGVKADDLLNRMEALALDEVKTRHQVSEQEARQIASLISTAALRYFMLKYTRNSIIAFDFEDALSFDGETGPYLQYSVVRANNIFRKIEAAEPDCLGEVLRFAETANLGPWLNEADDIWELILLCSRLPDVARQVRQTMELSILAKYAFNLAQKFNFFYHRHRIISESDRSRRLFLLLVVEIYRRQMTQTLLLLGIEIPDRM
jgi:arginyl-tRNA synthetase